MDESGENKAAEATAAESEGTAPVAGQSAGADTPADAPSSLLGADAQDGGEQAQADAAAETAPDKYEAFTDAAGNKYEGETLADFTTVAKDLGLTQEKAQKVFSSLHPVAEKWMQSETVKRANAWAEASRTDKEFGGEKFQQNVAKAGSAYKAFATPELRQLLDQSGLGNHPEMIRLFYRISQKLSQDQGVAGQGAPAAPKRMFPNSKMNL